MLNMPRKTGLTTPTEKSPNASSENGQRPVQTSLHKTRSAGKSKEYGGPAYAGWYPPLIMSSDLSCDFPLKGYRSASQRGPSGKPVLTFNPLDAIQSTGPIEVPCGNCMGCKLEQARQWKMRMVHESKLYNENCFLTLTYDDLHVPSSYSLDLRDFQLFMKRLRKHLGEHKIRFYACGEYGSLNGRPHYHAIIFNWDPPDKKLYKTINNNPQYTSRILDDVWQQGLASSGSVTPSSCGYVARYVTKKIKSEDTVGHDRYYRLSPVTGQFYSVKPEFSVMSRRPGIGAAYADRFKSDYYPSGFIVVEGRPEAVPRFYKSKLSEEEQHKLKLVALKRARGRAERTMERRVVRATVRDARIKNLKREL